MADEKPYKIYKFTASSSFRVIAPDLTQDEIYLKTVQGGGGPGSSSCGGGGGGF